MPLSEEIKASGDYVAWLYDNKSRNLPDFCELHYTKYANVGGTYTLLFPRYLNHIVVRLFQDSNYPNPLDIEYEQFLDLVIEIFSDSDKIAFYTMKSEFDNDNNSES